MTVVWNGANKGTPARNKRRAGGTRAYDDRKPACSPTQCRAPPEWRIATEVNQPMVWVKGIVGVILVLLGAVWIGQGVGLLPGSFMTGQLQWAIIGLVLVIVGAWLLWGVARDRRSVGARVS